MRVIFGVYLAVSMAMVAGCDYQGLSAGQLDDIREAVFRYEFDHNASGQQQHASTYCIAVDNGDPADNFIARFAQSSPPVERSSRCGMSRDHTHLVELTSGHPALLFRCDGVRRTWEGAVEVSGGYYEANLSASGNVYRLRKVGEKWAVVSDRRLWIS